MGCVCVCGYEVGGPRRAHVSIEHFGERGVSLVDIFTQESNLDNINSIDKSIIEKVQLIEQLDDKQKESIFSIIDMAIYNIKLKQTLSNALDL